MHFGENQLSRSLIGLSPLPTAHPPGFQPWWVRASTRSYPRFTLAMGRSLRFGSRARDSNALFRLAFATAPPHGLTSPRTTNSQAHSSKGTPSPLTTRASQLRRIVGTRFELLFHSPPGVLFTFPSRYSSAIGHQGVFRLTRWSWQIHGRLQESAATRENTQDRPATFTYRTITVYGAAFQRLRLATGFLTARPTVRWIHASPTTPRTQPLTGITRTRFSLNPLSLATTHGITCCFLLLRVLRCFTSPRSPLHPMNSDAGDTTQLVSGFPIRTPWDHSLVDSSPRPIAASHVLHRLLVPRHPPFALSNLTTKMLASTIQFSTNTQTPHTRHHQHPK